MSDLRVAIVGYGMAGRDFHAPLLRAADGLRVTHVVTGDPGRAAQVTADLSGVRVVPTPADLWADAASIDVLVVASPTSVHVEHAAAAAHLIAERIDGADEDRLLALAECALRGNWALLDGVEERFAA